MIYLPPPSWLAVTDPGTFDTCPRVSVHTHTSLYMYVWTEKEKAFCYLLIRFRARRVLAIKPWQPARLAPGLAERQRSPSQAATQNNTYTEAKLPLVGEQFPSLGENSLCFNITTTRMCTEVCACICVFSSARHMQPSGLSYVETFDLRSPDFILPCAIAEDARSKFLTVK